MKKISLLFLLITLFIQAYSFNDKDSISNKNNRFRIGFSVNLLNVSFWSKSDTLLMLNFQKKQLFPHTTSFFNPYGLTIGCRIFNNIYFEIGGNFSHQFIKELGDQENTGQGGNQKVFLSYEIKYFHIPISLTYNTNENKSIYINIGIKNNFIYHEHLYGSINKYAPQFSLDLEYVDKYDESFKFNSIIPFANIGGTVRIMKKKIELTYYGSFDLQPIRASENTIIDFKFYQFSLLNLQISYRF